MEIKRQIIVFDAADLAAESAFWAGLLGGTVVAEDDWHSVVVDGAWRLGIQRAPHHTPPEWPDGTQQQQVHLDLHVADLQAAHEDAIALGARLLKPAGAPADNPDGGEVFAVYADPAGHPFCLGVHAHGLGAPPLATPNAQGRPEPPLAGDEIATLLGTLERNRATLAWKCAGLDAAGLRATVGASSITLGGLLKHLALVEDDYFSVRLLGRDRRPPWDTVDWETDPDWEWRSAAEDTPAQLYALWQGAVARSRALVAEALADGGLDQLALGAWPDGRAPSLRRLLIDLIEEYARHTGHADLIREAVDGLVGEGSPDIHPPYQPPVARGRA